MVNMFITMIHFSYMAVYLSVIFRLKGRGHDILGNYFYIRELSAQNFRVAEQHSSSSIDIPTKLTRMVFVHYI